jgi:hypothetical protein
MSAFSKKTDEPFMVFHIDVAQFKAKLVRSCPKDSRLPNVQGVVSLSR